MAEVNGNEGLWAFTLAAYTKEGVQAGVIHLQDRFGADVNILFFCCYLAASGRGRLAAEDFVRAAAALAPWKGQVTEALRAIRDLIKNDAALWSLPGAPDARGKVLGAEIESERVAQGILESLVRERPSGAAELTDAVANLKAYLGHLACVPDETGRAALIALLAATFGGERSAIEAAWEA